MKTKRQLLATLAVACLDLDHAGVALSEDRIYRVGLPRQRWR